LDDGGVVVVLGDGTEAGAEDVLVSRGIKVGVGGHEVGGFDDDGAPAVEGFGVGVVAIIKFGIVKGMGLLPDKQRADGRGESAPSGPSILGQRAPFEALEAARARAESRILA